MEGESKSKTEGVAADKKEMNEGHGEKSHGFKQSHNKSNGQSKSSRSQREREIYRPPSMRSKSARNVNGLNNNLSSGHKRNSNKSGNSGVASSQNGGHGPVPTAMNQNPSPHLSRRQFPYGNGNILPPPPTQGRNNPEFCNPDYQLSSSQQQQIQKQQLANLLGQLDPQLYGEILSSASSNLGLYSLQQSKSLGNNLNAIFHQQQQSQQFNNAPFALGGALAFLQQSQRSHSILVANNNNNNNFCGPAQNGDNVGSGGQFRLSQSKSSGSIPDSLTKPRVRFDLDCGESGHGRGRELEEEATANMIKNAESRFSQMNLNGALQQRTQITSQKQQQLQKSRTGFGLNIQTGKSQNQSNQLQKISTQGTVKRSKSFGTEFQRQFNGVSCDNGGSWRQQAAPVTPPPVQTHYSDFQISKWPKRIQEIVTSAVTAVDRVAARQQIEMVNMIFDAMLTDDPPPSPGEVEGGKIENVENGNPSSDQNIEILQKGEESTYHNDAEGDLSTPAAHIFLYFIQKEKDRTVMESLLNTCFATFQKLFGTKPRQSSRTFDIFAAQSMVFLRFISCLYSQVKLLRRQKPGGRSLDDMSSSVLSILCDSCLAMLRSRLSSDPASVDCLFTVMTSQGRDIEGSFPLKMKQLLAAVRDALLGIGPYSQGPLCTAVQKTLMQLIELHAAAWALPASAVRYYYSNGPHHAKNNTNISNNTPVTSPTT